MKRPNDLNIKTPSLFVIRKRMVLPKGSEIILSGYADNRNIQSDAFRIRSQGDKDFKISQEEMIMIDPKTAKTSVCWVVTILETNELPLKYDARGRRTP